jgi:uncharacterized metal-binding protein
MGSIDHLWNQFWEIFRHGFAHISNPIAGVFIALIGGLMAQTLFSIFIISALAVVLHVAAEAVLPMVLNHTPFVMPKFDNAFEQYALALYIGYFVVILVIFGVKRLFASVRG